MNPNYPSAFSRAVDRVLADEGGYSDRAADPGGETRFGISQREYPDLDIAALTRAGAVAIYFRDWWLKFGYSHLPDPVACKVFDLAVNIGPDQAHRCLQRALRACEIPVREDGILGPATCSAASRAVPARLLPALRSEAAGYYRELAAQKPRDGEFIHGWLNRAYE